jgi:hypothetical protein
MIKTVTALRAEFWTQHPQFNSEYRAKKRQNDYSADVRLCWCEFVEWMRREGAISEKLAARATLG